MIVYIKHMVFQKNLHKHKLKNHIINRFKISSDRNKDNKEEAEAKFKEISAAYDILGDKEKRDKYDKFG